MMQQLMIQQLEINAILPQRCYHGLAHLSSSDEKICLESIHAFVAAYSSRTRQREGIAHCSNRIHNGRIFPHVFF
eukprot:scaffold40357_cov594-Skeletonema_dohrnii-CCMP3373.AAC.1